MSLHVLPLAVTMVVGPQIMAAIGFLTAPAPVRVSLGYLCGVLVAVAVGVTAAWGVALALGERVPMGRPGERGSLGDLLQAALVGLLLLLALRSYAGRRTAAPPRWLGKLATAVPGRALATGLLLTALMPSDVVVMLTVGIDLAHHGSTPVAAAPFVAATVLAAALPLLAFLVLGERARRVMPWLRDWTAAHGWLVNIAVYGIFIALVVTGG
ncbi:GAP family protein [Marinitenerispora sediminis]|uniref:GAP family protein n=1 Tax=Marinitenerispora sediminis TaxID=1931232 RepID=A0A368SYN8_9ACTN|nr:GAP family protein [Marinitenerispora sediminis]RCV48602.1 hypothetical protein DEF28_23035 [Marinitenerispora sediminis]RCV49615.1 hypothetical protein DEF24_25065 [Marinitenerispora sediminis]RCV50334.1 hypothetical protein DEF23_22220 [Marinitenerispora sediminis]